VQDRSNLGGAPGFIQRLSACGHQFDLPERDFSGLAELNRQFPVVCEHRYTGTLSGRHRM
jgi:hypothetical protein